MVKMSLNTSSLFDMTLIDIRPAFSGSLSGPLSGSLTSFVSLVISMLA